ncbi:MAG: ArsR/SmtB family transcription factor [Thermomicrobiales bacterium]
MTRDLGSEVDDLRNEVRELAQVVRSMLEAAPGATPEEEVVDNRSETLTHHVGDCSARVIRQPAELIRSAKEKGLAGAISYAGFYNLGSDDTSRESRWVTDFHAADDLLAQDDQTVARVLAALGNRQRLALLKAILEKPATAAELVERLGMGTTGQAYHHLKALQAADLIEQEERGLFAFKGPRVQSFLLLLAGVRDMLDAQYSSGVWDVESGNVEEPGPLLHECAHSTPIAVKKLAISVNLGSPHEAHESKGSS